MSEERLQKILARAGLGSRRACEEFIQSRRVTVNGRIAELGDKADPAKDKILFDGELLKAAEQYVYLIMNKPLGVLSSHKSQGGQRTVIDLVTIPQRVFPVGRLDLNSQGLILLTNDGGLANRLSHPRYGHEKEYRVLLDRFPDENQLDLWRRGVNLPDGKRTLPAIVKLNLHSGESPWITIILKQGRKRQIRETAKVLGLYVRKIIRVRIGPIRLGNLKSGEWRFLTSEEVRRLKQTTAKSISRRGSK
jgi:23S rRNA pseudouridine2605 synthase